MTDNAMAYILEEQREAREQLAAATLRANAAYKAEKDLLLAESVTSLVNENFTATSPDYQGTASYILPFSARMGEARKVNPLDPSSHPFGKAWLAGSVAYVCERLDKPRTYPSRVVYGSGSSGQSWAIGNSWTFRHDQTGVKLGEYRVVGVIVYGVTGDVVLKVGNVPNRRISGAVFK